MKLAPSAQTLAGWLAAIAASYFARNLIEFLASCELCAGARQQSSLLLAHSLAAAKVVMSLCVFGRNESRSCFGSRVSLSRRRRRQFSSQPEKRSQRSLEPLEPTQQHAKCFFLCAQEAVCLSANNRPPKQERRQPNQTSLAAGLVGNKQTAGSRHQASAFIRRPHLGWLAGADLSRPPDLSPCWCK